MYLTIEGVDTAGKSTQIEKLKITHRDAIFTKEPAGTEIGKDIREIILHKGVNSKEAELFLFLADRAEHTKEIIEPNLDKDIISDRSLISGIAYAMVNEGFALEVLISFNRLATLNILPSKVILLWLDFEELEKRISQKSSDKIEARGVEYLFDIQSKMVEVIKALEISHLIINASESIEDIHKKISEFIKKI